MSVPKDFKATAGAPGFARTAIEVGRSGFRLADQAMLAARLRACADCEEASGTDAIFCARCGCLMNVKARFATVQCPRVLDGEQVPGW